MYKSIYKKSKKVKGEGVKGWRVVLQVEYAFLLFFKKHKKIETEQNSTLHPSPLTLYINKLRSKKEWDKITWTRLCGKNTVETPPPLSKGHPIGVDIWPKGHIRAPRRPPPKAVIRWFFNGDFTDKVIYH